MGAFAEFCDRHPGVLEDIEKAALRVMDEGVTDFISVLTERPPPEEPVFMLVSRRLALKMAEKEPIPESKYEQFILETALHEPPPSGSFFIMAQLWPHGHFVVRMETDRAG